MIPTREELERLRDAASRAKFAMKEGLGHHNISQLQAMQNAAHPAMIAHLLACHAALVEYFTALDNSEDPTAVGSTCRLMRAESAARALTGAKP